MRFTLERLRRGDVSLLNPRARFDKYFFALCDYVAREICARRSTNTSAAVLAVFSAPPFQAALVKARSLAERCEEKWQLTQCVRGMESIWRDAAFCTRVDTILAAVAKLIGRDAPAHLMHALREALVRHVYVAPAPPVTQKLSLPPLALQNNYIATKLFVGHFPPAERSAAMREFDAALVLFMTDLLRDVHAIVPVFSDSGGTDKNYLEAFHYKLDMLVGLASYDSDVTLHERMRKMLRGDVQDMSLAVERKSIARSIWYELLYKKQTPVLNAYLARERAEEKNMNALGELISEAKRLADIFRSDTSGLRTTHLLLLLEKCLPRAKEPDCTTERQKSGEIVKLRRVA